jgi:hypothetical protein
VELCLDGKFISIAALLLIASFIVSTVSIDIAYVRALVLRAKLEINAGTVVGTEKRYNLSDIRILYSKHDIPIRVDSLTSDRPYVISELGSPDKLLVHAIVTYRTVSGNTYTLPLAVLLDFVHLQATKDVATADFQGYGGVGTGQGQLNGYLQTISRNSVKTMTLTIGMSSDGTIEQIPES